MNARGSAFDGLCNNDLDWALKMVLTLFGKTEVAVNTATLDTETYY